MFHMPDRIEATAEHRPRRVTALELDAIASERGRIGLLTLVTSEGEFHFELDDKAARALKKAMKRFLRQTVVSTSTVRSD
jgi:hypothetical protein